MKTEVKLVLEGNNSRPAYHQCYEILRDKILTGELSSGTKIVEEKLATELGVSRTPIRDSIRKLENEGLIVQKKVVKPTEKDLRNIFSVRILLEGYSARCAAIFLKENEIEKLYEYVEIGRKGTKEEIMSANEDFHNDIVRASNNPMMIDIIDRMQAIIYLLRKTVVIYNRPHLIDEHEDIYEAIKARDGEKAEALMKKHLENDLNFYLHVMSND
ncbi:GntR family transcriptional regulator [Paenibacillus gallinarum]|uniref:GntR family transcriptional regulator n=1 Tax=Paenibacillus gallinarum TaxID=2762232 RepID=A0ABR8T0S6_9BACL|nr:GntR family transcriptional regulator [Paenibacillus gallinarum]MBD7969353.1 GntR family transcriptional regulator [Paenibacillus gallinarum]